MVRPDDPRLEERLGYPTVGVDWQAITPDMAVACLMREIEYVLVHSSSHKYVDLEIAGEVAAGKRSRFSFSTMVTMAGTLMAEEAIRIVLGRSGGTDCKGYFFNPHAARVERPLPTHSHLQSGSSCAVSCSGCWDDASCRAPDRLRPASRAGCPVRDRPAGARRRGGGTVAPTVFADRHAVGAAPAISPGPRRCWPPA